MIDCYNSDSNPPLSLYKALYTRRELRRVPSVGPGYYILMQHVILQPLQLTSRFLLQPFL